MAAFIPDAKVEDVDLMQILCYENAGNERVEDQLVKQEENTGQSETNDHWDDFGLPQGKDYHVFFSYDSDDEVFLRDRVKSLESQPYNLKCCFSGRDFIPGNHIYKNIEMFMNKSLVFVMVLTPNFVNSGWCDFELGLALQQFASNGLRIVPLLLEECDIPDSLKALNYIEESRAEEIDNKIVEAVNTKAGPFSMLPTWFNHRTDVNGCGIELKAYLVSKYAVSSCFPYPDEKQVAVLRDVGAKIDVDVDFIPLIDKVNQHWSLKYSGFLHRSRHCCFASWSTAILISALLQFLIAAILMLYGFPTDLIIKITVTTFVLLTLLLGCVHPCCESRCTDKAEREVNQMLLQHNVELYKKSKIIVSFRAAPTLCLALIYYNTEPCKKFIARLLKARDEKRCQKGSAQNTDAQQESKVNYDEMAGKNMDSLVERFAPILAKWESLPVSGFIFRHRTKQDKMCLCQLFEICHPD